MIIVADWATLRDLCSYVFLFNSHRERKIFNHFPNERACVCARGSSKHFYRYASENDDLWLPISKKETMSRNIKIDQQQTEFHIFL